ncbi:hypothetical protein [Tardiphaga sp.]|uniref:hypothetical protein n=1 Tax=Tardiphaga sp. TaxID=1926292 RepID=UPI002614AB24|nr:hypothetical protein [Tardiphaga sp.]MDB5618028.1 hypothetical protein [Tardiphaga sp.]
MKGTLLSWLVVIVLASAGSADARSRRPADPTPFSHAPCSVLDGEPCTPSTCSVLDHGPCIPEINYPIGQNLQLTVMSAPADDQKDRYRKPDHDLDTIGDLFAALRSCWSPPAGDAARAGMQMSVMFSFRTSGAAIAPPRLTFASRDAPKEARDAYLKAIGDSLGGCLPLKLTKGFAAAIAGRPIMIRYVDNRNVSQNP